MDAGPAIGLASAASAVAGFAGKLLLEWIGARREAAKQAAAATAALDAAKTAQVAQLDAKRSETITAEISGHYQVRRSEMEVVPKVIDALTTRIREVEALRTEESQRHAEAASAAQEELRAQFEACSHAISEGLLAARARDDFAARLATSERTLADVRHELDATKTTLALAQQHLMLRGGVRYTTDRQSSPPEMPDADDPEVPPEG